MVVNRTHKLVQMYTIGYTLPFMKLIIFHNPQINWRELVTQLYGEGVERNQYNVHVYFKSGLNKVFKKIKEQLDM